MTVEQNKAIARRTFDEAFVRGNVADGGTDRQHPDEPSFRAHLKAVIGATREAFPDLRWEIDQVIGEGDWVALHSFMIGTHDGSLRPPLGPRVIPATGRSVRVPHMHMIASSRDRATSSGMSWTRLA